VFIVINQQCIDTCDSGCKSCCKWSRLKPVSNCQHTEVLCCI